VIGVKLMGGLANQMFQYAAGHRLANAHQAELKLDATSYFENQPTENTPRHYELGCYPIVASLMSRAELAKVDSSGLARQKRFSFGRAQLLKRFVEQDSAFQSFQPKFFDLSDNTYLDGYWQNEKYFIDIRDQLLAEFVPKQLSGYTQKLAREIAEHPSVAIHVRRGDYVSNKHASKFHGLMSADYYQQALKQITKKAGPVRCYVFSDDIDWCRKNLKLDPDTIYVSGNGPDRGCEDIYLMQRCRHNIIANSSFSWWGGWLNDNPDKIVIAPKRWFHNKESNDETEIVPTDWIRI